MPDIFDTADIEETASAPAFPVESQGGGDIFDMVTSTDVGSAGVAAEQPSQAATAVPLWERIKNARKSGQLDTELGLLRAQQIYGNETPEIDDRIAEIKAGKGKLEDPVRKERSWWDRAVTGAANMTPIMESGIKEGTKRGVTTGAAAGLAAAVGGQMGPQVAVPEELVTVPLSAGTAFAIGMTSGTMQNIGEIEAGLAYDEMVDLVDEAGNKIDPTTAKTAAAAVGVINAALEGAQISTLVKSFPGGREALSKLVRSVATKKIKEIATKKGAKAAAVATAKGALKYGKDVATETGQELLQETTNIVATEVAKKVNNELKGTDLEGATAEQITDRLKETAVESALSFAALSAPGHTLKTSGNVRNALKTDTEPAPEVLPPEQQPVTDESRMLPPPTIEVTPEGTAITSEQKNSVISQGLNVPGMTESEVAAAQQNINAPPQPNPNRASNMGVIAERGLMVLPQAEPVHFAEPVDAVPQGARESGLGPVTDPGRMLVNPHGLPAPAAQVSPEGEVMLPEQKSDLINQALAGMPESEVRKAQDRLNAPERLDGLTELRDKIAGNLLKKDGAPKKTAGARALARLFALNEQIAALTPTTTPEAPATMEAQMRALTEGRKPAVLVTPGEALPEVPDGFKTAKVPEGTLIFSQEGTLNLARSGRLGSALGYGIDGKPEGAETVVTARDQDGTVIQDVVTDGSQEVMDAAQTVAGEDGTVEVRPAEDAIAEREAGQGDHIVDANEMVEAGDRVGEVNKTIPDAKEPWQMTQAEWNQQDHNITFSGADSYYHRPDGKKVLHAGTRSKKKVSARQHEHEIKRALRDGKPVPDEVLAEYPGLQKNAEDTSESEQTPDAPDLPSVQHLTDEQVSPNTDKRTIYRAGKQQALEAIGEGKKLYRALFVADKDRHADNLEANPNNPHRAQNGAEVKAVWFTTDKQDARRIAGFKDGDVEIAEMDPADLPETVYLQNADDAGYSDRLWLGVPGSVAKDKLVFRSLTEAEGKDTVQGQEDSDGLYSEEGQDAAHDDIVGRTGAGGAGNQRGGLDADAGERGVQGLAGGGQEGTDTEVQAGDSDPAAAGLAPLHITPLSDKTFLVKGDTKPHKNRLGKKGLKGWWDHRHKGWAFPKTREAEVREALQDLLEVPAETKQPPSYVKPKMERSAFMGRVADILERHKRLQDNARNSDRENFAIAYRKAYGEAVTDVLNESLKQGADVADAHDFASNLTGAQLREYSDSYFERAGGKDAAPQTDNPQSLDAELADMDMDDLSAMFDEVAGEQIEEAAAKQEPAESGSSAEKAIADRIVKIADQITQQGTNKGRRPMDTKWEPGAVKRMTAEVLNGILGGRQFGKVATAKVNLAKAKSANDLRSIAAKLTGEQTQRAAEEAPSTTDAQTASKIVAEAAKHGVKGVSEAMQGLVDLFGGADSLKSFPSGLDRATYEQAKPHFQKALGEFRAAGKGVKEFLRFIVENFSARVKPYLMHFLDEVKSGGKNASAAKDSSPSSKIADRVAEALANRTRLTWRELFKISDEAYGGTQAEGAYTIKDAYDALELGVNRHLLQHFTSKQFTGTAKDAAHMVEALKSTLDLIPTQSKRTAEQDEFQQFSTPPTYAYVANWVANVRKGDTVLEPSAGVGGLAIFARNVGADVVVNELSERRAALLREFGFDQVHTENAEHLNAILGRDVKPDVVVMNPPFSATAGRVQGQRKTAIGAKHVEEALKMLKPRGRLVAIVGQGMAHDAPAFRNWWKKIGKEYNVRANIGIDGAGYRKYGTTFDNQLLVIDKTAPNDNVTVGKVQNIVEVPALLEEIRNDRPQTSEPTASRDGDAAEQGGEAPAQGSETGAGTGRAAGTATDAVGAGRGNQVSKQGTDKPVPDGTGNADLRTQSQGGHGVSDQGRPGRSDAEGGTPAEQDSNGGRTGNDRGARPQDEGRSEPAVSEVTVAAKEAERSSEALTDSVYESYRPQRLEIPGAKDHPGKLVQSAAMASVDPPAPTYTPNLPKNVISKGKLSIAQLEAVVYAGQAHSQTLPDGSRKGYFIGDGTGVGKGREIAGIILDNFRQGRKKAVWISETGKLVNDARRDAEGVGLGKGLVFDLSKHKLGTEVTGGQGVLFTTYATLASNMEVDRGGGISAKQGKASRLSQIIGWLGEDFDGVIVFDEAHNMQNSTAQKGKRGVKKPSARGLAGVELQKLLPQARIVYVSATGATAVENLGFASRLGLWGPGTAFGTRSQFIEEINSAGLAAMELVARDLKAMGGYIARSLDYNDVTYGRLEHPLDSHQRKIYDTLARAWQTVLQNINDALTACEAQGNARAKSNAMSKFWGAHQRFFNQVITSMQMPSVVSSIRQDIKDGRAVVLQLVNTNETVMNRQIAKAASAEDLEDVDMTPRESLMQYLERAFPTQQYEEYTDDEGNVRTRPVTDSKGNPIENPEAVAMRERLLDELGSIKVPDGPLEIILNEFGPNNVAEVTGRTRRVVRDAEGKAKIEKWSQAKASSDADAFMADKKQILVFSEAGGTGRSYHADLTKKNQRPRSHYLVQPGWRADKAVQGFGRTHRTNQASTPHYALVTTDLQGQRRFVSSIARKLAQLGALTKGQRETGNQGMFSEKDNLESRYASDALERFFSDLFKGKIDGLDFADTLTMMGYGWRDADGKLTSRFIDDNGSLNGGALPEIPNFLNRILSLEIDVQGLVFDAFAERMEQNIEAAIANGTLETGMENYRADKVAFKQEQTVYAQPESGAETKYVELEAFHKVAFVPFDKAKTAPKHLGFYRNKRSGQLWAVREYGSKTSGSGRVLDQYRLQGPTLHQGQILTEEKFQPEAPRSRDWNWEKVDEAQAEQEWQRSIKQAKKYRTEGVHLITGAILPIWDRLPGGTLKVVRVQADDGRRFLGRLIESRLVNSTLQNLGATPAAVDLTPKQALDKVLKERNVLHLANGWKIQRSQVSGEARMELKGDNLFHFRTELEQAGVFTERINYTTRFFVPVDSGAALGKILVSRPIAEVVTPDGDDAPVFSRKNDAEAFVSAPDGSQDFGEIGPEVGMAIRRQAGPIRLQKGIDAHNIRFGLAHIEEQHKKQLAKQGVDDLVAFVYAVTSGYDEIRRGDKGWLFLVKRNGRIKTAVLRLKPSEDGDFYTVESAWTTGERYLKNKELLWERSAPAQPDPDIGSYSRNALSEESGRELPSDQGQSNSVEPSAIDRGDVAEAPLPVRGSLDSTVTVAQLKEAVKNDPAFSSTNPQQQARLTKQQVLQTIGPIAQNWKNAPRIEAVQSIKDLPTRLKDYILSHDPYEGAGIDGVFDPKTDTIFLIADGLPSAERAQHVLLHEVVGHYGLRGVFGKDFNRILDQIGTVRLNDLRPIAVRWGYDLRTRGGRRGAAEEWLAEIAGRGETNGFWKRAIAAIRSWLREMGFNLKLSDADIVAMIAKARRYVEQGGEGAGVKEAPTFSRAPAAAIQADQAPRPGRVDRAKRSASCRLDYLRMKFQDKFLPLKRTQQALKQQGWQEREDNNPYLAEELYHGIAKDRLDKFEAEQIAPMMEAIKAAPVSLEELEQYLYAKHAPERNAYIQKINQNFEDGGSGMTDHEAAAAIDRFRKAGKLRTLHNLAQKVWAMAEMQRDIIREEGLEEQERLDAWEQFNFYVPLKGAPDGLDAGHGRSIGRGFAVSRSGTRSALGRRSQAENILAHLAAQTADTIVRAERAKVGKAFLQMVEENPDPSLWTVRTRDDLPTRQVLAKNPAFTALQGKLKRRQAALGKAEDGAEIERLQQEIADIRTEMEATPPRQVSEVDDFEWIRADNVLPVTRDGKVHYIQIENQDLARVMKNLGAADQGKAIRALAWVNRVLAMVNTSLNPEFVVTNFERDFQTAMINLSGEQSAKAAAKTAQGIPAAMRGIRNALRGKNNSDMAKWYARFKAAGGQVGYLDLQSVDQTQHQIQKLVREQDGKLDTVWKFARKVGKFVGDYNTMVENAVRLSAFKTAIENGMSEAKAASLAKNLTVNFNRKGELGPAANALYLFFNAGVQGSARIVAGLAKSKRTRKICAGITLAAFALAEMNRLQAGDDDDDENRWDKVSEYTKSTNLLVMRGDGSGDAFKVKLPYGYNLFVALGYTMSDVRAYLTSDGKHGKSPAKGAVSLFHAAMNAFNPLGGDESLLQMASPTIADPFVQVATNENFMGTPIRPEQPSFGPPKPRSELYWSSVRPMSKAIAKQLNELTGGNSVEPGVVDISPEVLDHFWDFVTGGGGRFYADGVNAMAAMAKGDETPIRRIPFARQAYQEKSEFYDRQHLHDNMDQVAAHYGLFKEMMETGRKGDAMRYRQEHPEIKLKRTVNALRQRLSRLRQGKEKLENVDKQRYKDRIERIEQEIQRLTMAFNRKYNQTVTR